MCFLPEVELELTVAAAEDFGVILRESEEGVVDDFLFNKREGVEGMSYSAAAGGYMPVLSSAVSSAVVGVDGVMSLALALLSAESCIAPGMTYR